MPPQPKWQAHATAIRTLVAALETPALDRGMIEELFAVARRQAIRLMADMLAQAKSKAPRQGTATVIERDQLLAWLDRLLATRPVQGEIARRRHLDAQLAQAQRDLQPQQIRIEAAAMQTSESWPQGIALAAPGVLTIRFATAEQLLGAVLALAEAAAADFSAFEQRVEQSVAGREEPGA